MAEAKVLSAIHGAITALVYAEAADERLAAKPGIDGEEDVPAAMRKKNREEIIEADTEIGYRANLFMDGLEPPCVFGRIPAIKGLC